MRRLIAPKPKEGTQRTIRRFLFLPLTLNNDWRWLTWVTIRQVYIGHRIVFGFGEAWRSGWVNGEYVDD